MARIYYTSKALCGNPIETNHLTPALFNHIKNNSTSTKFECRGTDVFRFATIWRDNIFYKQFYLPDSIILYDVADFNFPTLFYFVVNIDNALEVRKGMGGEKVTYQDFPQIHTAVSDPQLLEKIGRTLMTLSEMISGQPKPDNTPKAPAPLPEAERDAYRQLIHYCMPMHHRKENTLQFIHSLPDYKGDTIHLTTLNYVMNNLEDQGIQLVIRLDWKASVADLEWKLSDTLKDNFGITPAHSLKDLLSENLMVSADGVWDTVAAILLPYGLEFSFIDTRSDEYILAVYHKEHGQLVEHNIRQMGY